MSFDEQEFDDHHECRKEMNVLESQLTSLRAENEALRKIVYAAKKMNIERSRMVDRWSESDSVGQNSLWKNLHEAGGELETTLEILGEDRFPAYPPKGEGKV